MSVTAELRHTKTENQLPSVFFCRLPRCGLGRCSRYSVAVWFHYGLGSCRSAAVWWMKTCIWHLACHFQFTALYVQIVTFHALASLMQRRIRWRNARISLGRLMSFEFAKLVILRCAKPLRISPHSSQGTGCSGTTRLQSPLYGSAPRSSASFRQS